MKTIILSVSCLMLVSCVAMIIMLLKEKKRLTNPIVILAVVTIFVSLFMISKFIF